jgi:hypothetical protein
VFTLYYYSENCIPASVRESGTVRTGIGGLRGKDQALPASILNEPLNMSLKTPTPLQETEGAEADQLSVYHQDGERSRRLRQKE